MLIVATSLFLFAFPTLATALPRFEAHWESEKSYEDVDPLVSPWHIRLGDINVGPAGYLEGPNVVTIDSADYCVESCQEEWPDEFCSDYPPEGVPNRPRVVDDWGTNYNITAKMVRDGIKSIHERGGQVLLSYGGRHEAAIEYGTDGSDRSGIGAQAGGGEYWSGLTERSAKHLAERIQRNLEDWDLDGVDFYYMDSTPAAIWSGSHQDPGTSGAYALAVLMNLRRLVGNTKTITYSTSRFSASGYLYYTQMAIIATIHPYLDVINLDTYGALSQDQLADLELHNIPLSKIGLLTTRMTMDLIGPIVEQVKDLGMAGVTLFSINSENEEYRGELARRVAEELYL